MKKGLLFEEYIIKGSRVKYFLGYLENSNVEVYNYKVEKQVKVSHP